MRDYGLMAAACAAALSFGAQASAQSSTAQNDAAIFGVREDLTEPSLSPDGKRVAFLAPIKGQGSALMIADVAGAEPLKVVTRATGDPDRISKCKWAANDRLFCELFAVISIPQGITYSTRMFAINTDGSNVKIVQPRTGAGDSLRMSLWGGGVIDWLPDEDGDVLMMRDYVPESSTGTMLGQRGDGLGVDRLDTRTLSSKTVERPDPKAAEFITDGRGVVRIVGRRSTTGDGYDTGVIRYSYRKKGSRDWIPLSNYNGNDETGFNPYHVDSDLDVAYGLEKVNGKFVAVTFKLDGSNQKAGLFEAPGGVDVSGFAQIGRRGRVVGVTYVTDRREVRYTDPELAKLASGISKALPNLPLIRFVDSSVDESVLLIWAGSDRDPGRYYLLDRKTKSMGELLPSRSRLSPSRLSEVKPITYKAADGTVVPAYLTLPQGTSGKNLPAIVMPHGGPGARDEWGFDWLSQFYAARGFAVIQPNFRGSTGYGDAWFQKNGFQGWQTAIGDVRDAGNYLVREGIADSKKLAIVGWSYGGYAALQTAATSPDLFHAVVAIAPVTDLETLRQQYRGWTSFEVASAFIGKGAHVESGSPARHADAIKAPVLMFHGTYDRNVDVAHARLMARRLKDAGKQADLIIYDKLDHYLEDSEARTDMLSRSDAFLRKSLGIAN